MQLQLELMEQRFADNNGEATPNQLHQYQSCSNSMLTNLREPANQPREKGTSSDVTARIQPVEVERARVGGVAMMHDVVIRVIRRHRLLEGCKLMSSCGGSDATLQNA
jgi:hypothetical protein